MQRLERGDGTCYLLPFILNTKNYLFENILEDKKEKLFTFFYLLVQGKSKLPASFVKKV